MVETQDVSPDAAFTMGEVLDECGSPMFAGNDEGETTESTTFEESLEETPLALQVMVAALLPVTGASDDQEACVTDAFRATFDLTRMDALLALGYDDMTDDEIQAARDALDACGLDGSELDLG
jgi:hypothetical protein